MCIWFEGLAFISSLNLQKQKTSTEGLYFMHYARDKKNKRNKAWSNSIKISIRQIKWNEKSDSSLSETSCDAEVSAFSNKRKKSAENASLSGRKGNFYFKTVMAVAIEKTREQRLSPSWAQRDGTLSSRGLCVAFITGFPDDRVDQRYYCAYLLLWWTFVCLGLGWCWGLKPSISSTKRAFWY